MPTPTRLPALTGLRFPAALAVAACHLTDLTDNPALGRTARRVLAEGFAGVPFFFVLSGFVLAYSYHDRLTRPGPGAAAGYYRSRVARIWPLHLFALLLVLVMPYHPSAPGFGPLAANALLVQSWVPGVEYAQSYNQVTWTLSIEVFFYLLLPVFLRAVGRRNPGPGRLAALAALSWAGPAALVAWHTRHLGDWSLYLCNVCPAVRFGEFASGAFLALLFVRSGGPDRGPISERTRARWTAAEVLVLLLVAAAVKWSDRVHVLLRLNGYYTPVFALVVAVFARGRGRASDLLASRPAVYLGEISFAFFILHPVLFDPTRWVLLQLPPDLWPGLTVRAMIVLAVALAAAAAAHHLIEVPARERVLAVGRRRERPAHIQRTRRPGLRVRRFARPL